MDARRLPAVVFVVTLFLGVLAKLWRAGDLWLEAGALDGFRWLPVGLGAELVVAGLFAGITALALRLHLWLAGVVVGAGLGSLVFWLALNDVSFRISQIGITWERLRGDEGVAIKDFGLMATGDVIPAVVFAVVGVVGAGVLAAGLRARVPDVRALVAATVLGVVVYAFDVFVTADRNFGMGDSPVLLLARTWVRSAVGEEYVRLPRTRKPPQTKAERLAMLAAQQPPPPSSTTPTRAAPAVKNGVLFFSEGIARAQTGLGGEATTPNLMRLLQEGGGLDLTNYYTTYHKSIAAIFSMTCSDFPPPNAKNIMEVNPRIDCGALPEVMQKNGIHAGLFHGGDFGFYDKLQLLGMRGFEIQQDARAIAREGLWENDWGIDDRGTVDALLAWIDGLPRGERFFAVVIPITAHYPYDIPPDVTPAFPGHAAKDRFFSAVHFLDDAFGRLHAGLAQRGLADDTALFYLADHGETVAERPRAQAGRRLAYEPSLHVPFVVVAPTMFPAWQKNGRLGSHVDLLPTVLDVLGLPPDPRHHGQSLLSADFVPRRIFVGASNGPKYVGWVDGRQKFVVNRNSGLLELYDLDADPFEQHNLAPERRDEALRLADDALAFADGQLAHLIRAPRVPGEVDVQRGVLEDAQVTAVLADGTRVECPRDPAAPTEAPPRGLDGLPWRRACPGLSPQPFLGQRTERFGTATRTCALVNLPAGGGAVELRIPARPWLPFLTRVRAAVHRLTLDDDDEAFLTALGDGKQGQEKNIGADRGNIRVSFPSSQREVVIRLRGDRPLKAPVCLTFDEKSWRSRAPTAAKPGASPPPGLDGAAPRGGDGADVDDVAAGRGDGDGDGDPDDLHGRRPRP
jgi:hypothetical protein